MQSSKSRRTKNIDRSMWRYVFFSAVFVLITQSHRMFPATGAGKSSILNAVLDGNCSIPGFLTNSYHFADNIVPTSGMRGT